MLKYKHFFNRTLIIFTFLIFILISFNTNVYALEEQAPEEHSLKDNRGKDANDYTILENFVDLFKASGSASSAYIEEKKASFDALIADGDIAGVAQLLGDFHNPSKVVEAFHEYRNSVIAGTVENYGLERLLTFGGVEEKTARNIEDVAITVEDVADTVGEVKDALGEGFTGDPNNEYPVMMLQTIYSSSYSIANSLVSSDVYRTFVGSSGYGLTDYAPAENLHKVISIIGTFLVIAIAMGNYFKNIQQGKEPLDCVFQILVEIGIVGLFMLNLPLIMQTLFYLGKEIINASRWTPADAPTLDKAEAENILEIITGAKTGHFFWNVQAIIELVIPFIMSYILKIILVIQFMTLCFEIFLRKFFTPLAVADIYHEGFRSPGARYLKKYFGCYLKLACFFLILMALHKVLNGKVASYFAGADLTTFFVNMGMYIAINISGILVMAKTGEVINDTIGV